MTPVQFHDAFHERGQSLEEGYFRTQDSELVDKLRKVFETKLATDQLSKATGITNPEVLERMVKLNVRGEMALVFKLFPLVEIAWADGSFDESESDAVIKAAVKFGVPADGEAMGRLKDWLKRGPTPEVRALWLMYANELRKTLTPAELHDFRDTLLKHARAVAEASGGVLGMFFAESKDEKKVIADIKKVLTV